MVLKPDQERIKTLLADTITLLCKNGLTFESEFSIDALIGITLDKDDVFLVSIKESVGPKRHEGEDLSQLETETVSPTPSPSRKVRKRKIKSERSSRNKSTVDIDTETTSCYVEASPDKREASYASSEEEKFYEVEGSEQSQPKRQKPNSLEQELDDGKPQVAVKTKEEQDVEELDCMAFMKQEVSGESGWEPTAHNTDLTMEDFTRTMFDNISPESLSQTHEPFLTSEHWAQLAPTTRRRKSSRKSRNSVLGPFDPSTSGALLSPGSDPNQTSFTERHKVYQCQPCNKNLGSHQSLVHHEKWHKGEYRHYCDVCGKGFMVRQHFEGHMAIHSGVKQFWCPFCPKQYIHKTHLKDHLRQKHQEIYDAQDLQNRFNLDKLLGNSYFSDDHSGSLGS